VLGLKFFAAPILNRSYLLQESLVIPNAEAQCKDPPLRPKKNAVLHRQQDGAGGRVRPSTSWWLVESHRHLTKPAAVSYAKRMVTAGLTDPGDRVHHISPPATQHPEPFRLRLYCDWCTEARETREPRRRHRPRRGVPAHSYAHVRITLTGCRTPPTCQVILKGILNPGDSRLAWIAVRYGIAVSNHASGSWTGERDTGTRCRKWCIRCVKCRC